MQMNSKEHIFIQALANAVKDYLGNTAPSAMAIQYGISPATTSSLVNAKKDFFVTTIAKISEILNIKTSELFARTEKYLPENFKFYD